MTGNLPNKFDPFNDRKARLLRNRLSTALIEAIRQRDSAFLAQTVGQLEDEYRDPLYRLYIEERMESYRQVVARCPEMASECDVFQLTALLWQRGLFFEVHEVLEEVWGKATGQSRKALQGLIQAAGYFLLLEAGNVAGAFKLAEKAAANLAANRDQLPADLRIEKLVETLRRKERNPPPLR